LFVPETRGNRPHKNLRRAGCREAADAANVYSPRNGQAVQSRDDHNQLCERREQISDMDDQSCDNHAQGCLQTFNVGMKLYNAPAPMYNFPAKLNKKYPAG
jgi:hypothetical protein